MAIVERLMRAAKMSSLGCGQEYSVAVGDFCLVDVGVRVEEQERDDSKMAGPSWAATASGVEASYWPG